MIFIYKTALPSIYEKANAYRDPFLLRKGGEDQFLPTYFSVHKVRLKKLQHFLGASSSMNHSVCK